ncbi:MAG: thioredoxin-disulfide reductase, partial [Anaerolineaceae bacterium 4572_5.2]
MTEENTPRHVKALIIGSGPAGLTAALYAARANLAPVVLSGMDLGGQVSKTHSIENYPGFPEGISGEGLVKTFNEQAVRFGAEIIFDVATEVDFSAQPYRVKTYGEEFLADTIIITTGATTVTLNIPNEEEMVGRGVSYCATCDGHFFKNMDVVVVGGGDS